MTQICSFCFEPLDNALIHEERHAAEVAREESNPAYAAAKRAVIDAGTALAAAHRSAASSSGRGFREQMAAMVERLTAMRDELIGDLHPCASEDVDVEVLAGRFAAAKTLIDAERARLTHLQVSGSAAGAAGSGDGTGGAKGDEALAEEYRIAQEALDAAVALSSASSLPLPPPWRLKYFVETRTSSDAKVEFEGGVITDADGRVLWDVACGMCGVQIQRGAFGVGVERVVRLDSDGDLESVCMPCWTTWVRTFERHPQHPAFASGRAFRPPQRAFDVNEADEQTMLRVKLLSTAAPRVGSLLATAFAIFSARPCLGSAAAGGGGSYEWLTFNDVRQRAGALSRFLRSLPNCNGGDRLVGISSQNRWEYVAADVAAIWSRFVTVGLHTTNTPDESAEIINHAGATVLVVDGAQLETYVEILRVTDVDVLVCMDALPPTLTKPSNRNGTAVRMIDFATIFAHHSLSDSSDGTLFEPRPTTINDHDDDPLLTIIYTSGSAGAPKGVRHSEAHFRYDIGHTLNVRGPLVTVSYIPLSHSTDRMRVYETMLNGGRVGFAHYGHQHWSAHERAVGAERFALLRDASVRSTSDNGVGEILRDVALLRPTVFIAPPRVWKGLEAVFGSEGSAARSVFGSRLHTVATGGGPTDASTFQFVKAAFGLDLIESYGATEAGAIAIGTAGPGQLMPLVAGVDVLVAIADGAVPPAVDDEAIEGELLVATPTLSEGYWRNEATTAEAFVVINGRRYFRTGDIGVVERDAATKRVVACRVVDRRKNMMRLADAADEKHGEKRRLQSAERTEAAIEALCPQKVANCAVITIGPHRSQYVAVVSSPLVADPAKLEDEIMASIRHDFSGLVPPIAIVVDAGPAWQPDARNRQRGLLTVSLKVNRAAVELAFAERIAAAVKKLC